MLLQFTKMHGLGNDFVMLDLISQQADIDENLIKRLSDRRQGIGFDQMLTVLPPEDPDLDFKYTIYNADGSEAQQCGNGARCFLKFVRDRGLTAKTRLKLQTCNGIIECQLINDGNAPADDISVERVSVDMGKPEFEPAAIPFVADRQQTTYDLTLPSDAGEYVSIAALNIGNPHAILQVDDVHVAPVQAWGSLIESHSRFPERVNVSFMEVVSRTNIRLRVFERGVGETRACGTGACASVVAGRQMGLLDERVEVTLPGGSLEVSWPGEQASITMTGPAQHVYDGRIAL